MSETPIYDKVESGEINAEVPPVIPKKLRTIAYFVLGISSPAIGLATGLIKIWGDPSLTANVDASGIIVISFIGTVAGIFGIAYRPTK